MGGFFWLRPILEAYADMVKAPDRIPCDDVDAEPRPVAVAPRHAAFPAGALGASWSIAALVGE